MISKTQRLMVSISQWWLVIHVLTAATISPLRFISQSSSLKVGCSSHKKQVENEHMNRHLAAQYSSFNWTREWKSCFHCIFVEGRCLFAQWNKFTSEHFVTIESRKCQLNWSCLSYADIRMLEYFFIFLLFLCCLCTHAHASERDTFCSATVFAVLRWKKVWAMKWNGCSEWTSWLRVFLCFSFSPRQRR